MAFHARSFLTAMLLLWSLTASAENLTLTALDGANRPLGVNAQVQARQDSTGLLEIDAVVSASADGAFAPMAALPARLSAEGATWVRLTLSRTPDAPSSWLLRVRPAMIEAITLYAPDADGKFRATRAGSALPFAEREVVDHNAVLPLEVGTTPKDYYVRISSRTGGAPGSYELLQRSAFETTRTTDYAFIGALLGAAVFSIVLNLLFCIWLKDSIYFLYALYFACACMLAVTRQGYAAEWFLLASSSPPTRLVLAVYCVFNVVATAFVSRLFHFREHSVWMGRIFNFFIVYNALAFFVALTDHMPQLARWVGMGSTVSTTLSAGFVAYLVLVRRDKRYMLQAAAMVTGTFLGIYSLLHLWIYPNATVQLPDSYRLIGAMIHLLALNIAVVDRTRQAEVNLKVETERALTIAREAKQTLEAKVQARTLELTGANQQLKSEMDARSLLEIQLRASLKGQQQAMAQQQEFVSMVSHEFRNPLAVIDAAAQSLDLLPVGADAAVKPRISRIRRSVQRMMLLLENVLAADRLQLGQKSLKLRAMDIEELARAVCDSIGQPSQTRLQCDFNNPGVLVTGDRTLLEIALQNLITNALKYSRKDSQVRVALRLTDGYAILEVSDHGPGIAPAEQERIFDKYHRAEATEATPGSGLGLYLSREIARNHRGDVLLQSTDDTGSTFALSLPVTGHMDDNAGSLQSPVTA
ncbi:MAG: sensor histidine kinase [Pseudoxanthomonas sp.]